MEEQRGRDDAASDFGGESLNHMSLSNDVLKH
jgi:hypothetical protein